MVINKNILSLSRLFRGLLEIWLVIDFEMLKISASLWLSKLSKISTAYSGLAYCTYIILKIIQDVHL